ncbi:Rft protein-domain-containing protein [Syncephalis plumigaleata]|nr:Rft protein-domain-containing protein [Syncephalis plumigaleata]
MSESTLRQRVPTSHESEVLLRPAPSTLPDTENDHNNSNVLSQTMQGASYLVLLQFFSRMVTFTLNQILVRFTTPDVLGVASIQLELLIASVLFLSREGFRCALLRANDDHATTTTDTTTSDTGSSKANCETLPDGKLAVVAHSRRGRYQQLINLSYLPANRPPYYTTAVILYGVSALIELAAEPLFILAQVDMLFKLRVLSEGVGVVIRCVITLGITLYGAQQATLHGNGVNQLGVLAFAMAQFIYSVMLVGGHAFYFIRQAIKHPDDDKVVPLWQLTPHPIIATDQRVYYFDTPLLKLAGTFAKQSMLKHLLTEGDKILMAILCVYAFVVNYGSLVARIFYQPMEETIRIFFAKTFPSDDAYLSSKPSNGQVTSLYSQLHLASRVLASMVKFHLLCGLVFACFAPAYTGTLIDLLVGSQWSHKTEAPSVLALYCLYVPIMGVNGVAESFVQAIARPEDISAQSRIMMLFSLLYLTLGAVLMRVFHMGAAALVIANAFNMILRIAWSLRLARRRILEAESALQAIHPSTATSTTDARPSDYLSAKHMLPARWPSLVALLATIITWWSEQSIGWTSLIDKGKHIGVGAVIFLPFSMVVYPC